MLILNDNILLSLWNVILSIFIHYAYSKTWIRLCLDELFFFTFFINRWLIICRQFSVRECFPIHTIEKWMSFYFGYVLFASESCVWISIEQLCDDVLQVIAHVNVMLNWVWENNPSCSNENSELMVTFVHERWSASCHFVK